MAMKDLTTSVYTFENLFLVGVNFNRKTGQIGRWAAQEAK